MGRSVSIWLFLAALSTTACSAPSPPSALRSNAGAPHWTAATVISGPEESWFPDITEDAGGQTHVIWAFDNGLNYRTWSNDVWSAVTDLTATIGASQTSRGNVVRAAITADRKGQLHLFGTMLNNGTGNYSHAEADRAIQPSAWSSLIRIGDSGAGYYSALQADSRDRLHAVYTGRPKDSLLADTYYRRSEDGGATWSAPINLSGSPDAGSTRPQVLIDASDRLHVSWDEGWDRQTGKGRIQTSRYRWSSDGNQWSDAHTFGTADLPAAQLVVGSAGSSGTRLAVWRSSGDDDVYWQQSTDDGKTWNPAASIPGLKARSWNSTPFDQYGMAPDVGGVVHLVLVGIVRGSPSHTWQVIHVTWSQGTWDTPEVVFALDGFYPEYPRLSVGPRGLHLVWFTRKILWQRGPLAVWHSARAK